MVTVEFFLEGFYITILGVVVVFLVLALLALAMYGIGHLEKALIERKKPGGFGLHSGEKRPAQAFAV